MNGRPNVARRQRVALDERRPLSQRLQCRPAPGNSRCLIATWYGRSLLPPTRFMDESAKLLPGGNSTLGKQGNKSKARRLGDHLTDNATYNVRASKVAFHETNGGW